LEEEVIAIIKNLQQDVNSLKEKVRLLNLELYELKSKPEKRITTILGYGSEYDD